VVPRKLSSRARPKNEKDRPRRSGVTGPRLSFSYRFRLARDLHPPGLDLLELGQKDTQNSLIEPRLNALPVNLTAELKCAAIVGSRAFAVQAAATDTRGVSLARDDQRFLINGEFNAVFGHAGHVRFDDEPIGILDNRCRGLQVVDWCGSVIHSVVLRLGNLPDERINARRGLVIDAPL